MEWSKEQRDDIARMAREWATGNTTQGKSGEQEVAEAYIEGAELAAGMLEPELALSTAYNEGYNQAIADAQTFMYKNTGKGGDFVVKVGGQMVIQWRQLDSLKKS